MTYYVVHKGDEVVHVGTLDEVCEVMGMPRKQVQWLASPTAHRKAAAGRNRLVADRVEVGE